MARHVAFPGFRPEAIQFLADLAANNERDWFQPRKAEFERLLKEPFEALVGSARRPLRGARPAAPRGPEAVDLPHPSGYPVLEGQVPLQDAHGRAVPVDGW